MNLSDPNIRIQIFPVMKEGITVQISTTLVKMKIDRVKTSKKINQSIKLRLSATYIDKKPRIVEAIRNCKAVLISDISIILLYLTKLQ